MSHEIVDCPHSTPDLVSDGQYLLARTSDILTGVFRPESARRVSEETYRDRTRRAVPQNGDLLFSREGTYFGVAAEVPPDTKVCLGQRMVLIRPDPTVIDPTFLRFWLNGPRIQVHLGGQRDGSVAERLNLSTIRKIPIAVPPILDQHVIATVLGALDDKIELNRQMSQTLEEIARTLFRSWFVDFDPVHAKAADRQPVGMDAETAALFPSEFEESELGLIPKGWRVSTIGEEVKVVGGSTPSTSVSAFWDGGTNAWATPKDLASLQIPLLTSTERQITDEGVQQISSRQLPSGTLLMSSRAPVGYMAISQIPISINQGFIAMICDGIISSAHALWWAQANLGEIRGRANGTTFQEISKSNFRPIPIIVPALRVARRFSDQTAPLIDRMALLIEESLTLKNLRDTLLPRLLSGELQFS